MKAIKVIDKQPVLVDAPIPKGDGVRVKVVSSSICGSDLHMMAMGYLVTLSSAMSLLGSPTTADRSQLNHCKVAANAVFVMRVIASIVSRGFP